MAKIVGNSNPLNQSKTKAFTLAEVLITLVIIGVVAALTIPNIVANYQKKQYVTQLKKTYTYLTNGFHTMMAQDGVTQLSDTKLWTKLPAGTTTAETLLTNGGKEAKEEFLKVFNTAAIYGTDTMPERYKSVKYKMLNGSTIYRLTSGIYLNDGIYVNVEFSKSPNIASCGSSVCKSLKEFQEYKNTPTKLWRKLGSIYFDVNGIKGPNQTGRDLFYFTIGDDGNLYPKYGIDQVASAANCASYNNLSSCNSYWKNNTSVSYNCSTTSESRGVGCAARIIEDNWQMNY